MKAGRILSLAVAVLLTGALSILTGCASGGDSTGGGGNIENGDGKAQALVFTSPG